MYGLIGGFGLAFWVEDEDCIWYSQNCVTIRREGGEKTFRRTEVIVKNKKMGQ